LIALMVPGFVGCGPSGNPALIVATSWPPTERTQFEDAFREATGDRRPIDWVISAPGERLESVIDRRGGVDVLLGGPASTYGRLAVAGRLHPTNPSSSYSWRAVRRPEEDVRNPAGPPSGFGDPRVDPGLLALAKATLGAEGWSRGYERLVRRAARARGIVERSDEGSGPLDRTEGLAVVRGGPNQDQAMKFLQALESRGLAGLPTDRAIDEATADDLLADLLGAALVDSLDELREADAALARFGRPAKAEAAIAERPPWPPASVAKLRLDPNGEAMVGTLLGQIAPDPESRGWLIESWSKPKRPIDGALLDELAGAAHGRLAGEPRFRAWLRSEWTAWTRQLYRRVARVAGGPIPS
jgi:hypothetical protein